MQQEQKGLYTALGEIQRLLGERFGTGILTDGQRTVSFLMDMLPADTKSHNRMRMFYASHADSALLTEGLPAEQRVRRAANIYADYTDCSMQLALSLMDAILAATGEQTVLPAEPARPAEPETVGLSLEEIKRILSDPVPREYDPQKPLGGALLGSPFAHAEPAQPERLQEAWTDGLDDDIVVDDIDDDIDDDIVEPDEPPREKTTQNHPTAIEQILDWPCVRVRQPDIYPVLRKAMEWQGEWVSWSDGRRAVEERRLDDGRRCREYKRLVELCKKAAAHDADCMQLLADWYHDGLTVSDYGRQTTLVEKDPEQSRQWEDKAAEAGHSTAIFNQAVRARDEGEYLDALVLAARAITAALKMPRPHDGFYLSKLAVEKKCASAGMTVELDKLMDGLIVAKLDKHASRENRENVLGLIRHLEQMGVKPTSK